MIEQGLNVSSPYVKWLDSFLNDIIAIDKQSDMFRYPFNLKMKSFLSEQKHLNLKALAQNMNTAYDILNYFLNNEFENHREIEYAPTMFIYNAKYEEQSVVGKI
nr:hypothetical protein [Bacillus cereus]